MIGLPAAMTLDPVVEPTDAATRTGAWRKWSIGFWSIVTLLGALSSYADSPGAAQGESPARALWAGAVVWLPWLFLTPVVVRLGQRWPLDRGRRWKYVARHLIAAVAVGSLAAAATAVAVFEPDANRTIMDQVRARVLLHGPMGSTIYLIVLGVSYMAINTARLRERELVAERLMRELAEAQLSVLRMQLQPHFLFNSLNAVIALVRDQATERADRALVILSDVLRATLSTGVRTAIPLRQELAFTSKYLEIESLRFGDRLRVRFSTPPDLHEAEVPSFILQPLAENALRHGVIDRPSGGTVSIAAERRGDVLRLSVDDDGVGLPSDWEERVRRGVGISNLRSRLAHMYGDGGTLTIAPSSAGRGTTACIELPYRVAG